MSGRRSLLLFALSAATFVVNAKAQLPVREPDQLQLLNRMMSGELTSDPLKCQVQTMRPFLDFAFRFEAGYLIRCPLAQFEGKNTAVATYLRIQPDGGQPVFLGEGFRMPEMSGAMRAAYAWKHMNQEMEFSGVFAAGIGTYGVDLVVIDDRHRIYRKSWELKINAGRSERKAQIAMQPGTAGSAELPPWHNARQKSERGGPHLTVLLNAAPILPAAQRLRAWDRAFLMSSLTSLLRGVQPSSVRLIAFNLEQQKEVYHEETFNRNHFPKLGEALQRLELGSVSYKTLQAQGGWADMLTSLVDREARGDRTADAVVFLGPNIRNMAKIPKESLPCEGLNSRLYYLEFFPIPGSEFPDTIHQLTNTCHGNVYRMHSPADLADAISKLQARMPVQP